MNITSLVSAILAQTEPENTSVETLINNVDKWHQNFDWNIVVDLCLKWGGRIAGALIIFFVGKYLAKLIAKKLLSSALKKMHMEATIADFLTSVVEWLIMIFAIIAAADTIGVPMTSFMAILGAAGLAVGLAFKNSMENFATGIMIITMKPFQAGDFIEVGSISGTVKKIKIFHTILNTTDNRKITVPNGTIYAGSIVNYSANPTRRVDMTVSVSYSDDLKAAKELIAEILAADSRVLKEPAPKIGVSELGDHGITIIVRPWVKSEDYWPVKFDALEAMKTQLEAAGMSIPFHQLDVRVVDMPREKRAE